MVVPPFGPLLLLDDIAVTDDDALDAMLPLDDALIIDELFDEH